MPVRPDDDARRVDDEACEVVTIRSGVKAVRDRSSGEVMHPGLGPAVEAHALYVIPSCLEARLLAVDEAEPATASPLVLFDVGLGAASNAIAAWRVSEALPAHARRLEIASFEHDLHALRLAASPEHAAAFGLDAPDVAAAAREILAHGRYETARTTWRLCFGDVLVSLAREPARGADIVFWDMYSRKANPKLWTVSTFDALFCACRDGATVHTYSAATSTRSALLLAGFAVGVGEATGMKEQTTVAAMSARDLARPLDARWLVRLGRSSAAFPSDVATDPDARAAALAAIQSRPQFVNC